MNTLKKKNMMAAYAGFTGHQTVTDILSKIPKELKETLTGKQLGQAMNAVNAGHQSGKQYAVKELEAHIDLPTGVSIWAVIGTDWLGCEQWTDGISDICDVMQARGNLVKKWEEKHN